MPYSAPVVEAVDSAGPDPSDVSQLNLLAILHYVYGGIGLIRGCFQAVHVGLGITLLVNPELLAERSSPQPPPEIAYFVIYMGMSAIAFAWISSICVIVSGNYLKQQRRRIFSIVVSALCCASVPLGTALGVFTIVVLMRSSVIRLYEQNRGL